ncbi:MAG: 30S ribosomal protein S4, partial [Candidatus Omnitrophica bacterium]|nr:30S ribosomal protein S4 [Candidatus Omnitrophota bacterium]
KAKLKEVMDQYKDKTIPPWLKADLAGFKGEIVGMPTKQDVGFPINEQLIVELYSK